MAGFLNKVKRKFKRFNQQMEDYHESITFAEAGQHDYALRLKEKHQKEDRRGKLLVIGKESQFSEGVIDYSLDMARRMSFEIIALNTAPLSCKTFSVFSSSLSNACKEFKEISEQNITSFQQHALQSQIPFTHVVKFNEVEHATVDIQKEFGNIDFVVSEPEEERTEQRIQRDNRVQNEIFVYSMV
ncbi:hypothetical protein MHK_007848 [Candidatus Magnetomorum sp. HK-1]|nr:hypothetical protein MHK_007848 [Candidatus Magnetomorum sp. HK-1]